MTENVRSRSKADLVKEEFGKRILSLQGAYLRDESDAVATLAQLRRCDPDEPGADPRVWQVTIGGLPEELQGGTDVSVAERAAHAVMVLYAVHQQSSKVPMHQARIGLGSAVQRLADARGHDGTPDQASIRRLHQVVLATDRSARLYHLRGLITLLRGESEPIPLDYGLLGADLWRLLNPKADSSGTVARWGRQLHTRPRTPTTGESE